MPTYRHIIRILLAAGMFWPLQILAQAANQDQGIMLLQPIGGITSIPTQGNGGLGVFGTYFDLLYPWIIGMGAGIAILNGVIGGIQIIQAGGDQTGVGNGKNRLLISMGGLVLILASATILNALNPTFFH